MSLRSKVFKYLDNHDVSQVAKVLREFPDDPKKTVKRYYFAWKKINEGDITSDILLTNLDTIKEMEISIQQIKDPVKRCENLARLHTMKLKPIANKDEKSLRELLEEI